MEVEHLVPYSLDEAIDGIQEIDPFSALVRLWGVDHWVTTGSVRDCNLVGIVNYLQSIEKRSEGEITSEIDKQLRNMYKESEKDIRGKLDNQRNEKNDSLLLHMEYCLIRRVLNAAKALSWKYLGCIMEEIPPAKRKEIKNKLKDDEKNLKKMIEEYKQLPLFGSKETYSSLASRIEMVGSLITEIQISSLLNEKPLHRNIRKIPGFVEIIDSLYNKLITCAQFHSSRKLPEYAPEAEYERAIMYNIFMNIFVPESINTPSFFNQSPELKQIYLKHKKQI